MTYAEWAARPASVNDAECLLLLYPKADVRYGDWDTYHAYAEFIPSGKPWKTHSIDAKPIPHFTTDRNATAMLVEEVKRRGEAEEIRFGDALALHIPACQGSEYGACGPEDLIDVVSAAPSLVAWACVESCREVQ